MQQVLSLAFGSNYEQDVTAVTKAVESDAEIVEVRALDLARRGGKDLMAAILATPVDDGVLRALVRRPRRNVVLQLIDQLAANDCPESARQAIGWVLQRVLKLDLPPIDPTEPRPLQYRDREGLRRLASRLPD